jgi:hypothetical protein
MNRRLNFSGSLPPKSWDYFPRFALLGAWFFTPAILMGAVITLRSQFTSKMRLAQPLLFLQRRGTTKGNP